MLSVGSQIVVFCGPMRSGKSKELFLIIDRLNYQKIPYKIFTPKLDTKNKEKISSRFLLQNNKSIIIDNKKPEEIFKHISSQDFEKPFAVIIDEAQFFDKSLIDVVKKLMFSGVNTYIGGLDCDANFQTFGPMGDLMAIATKVKKLTSVCQNCKSLATMSALATENESFKNSNILIGDDLFLVFCSACYKKFKNKQIDLKNIEQ